MDFIGQKGQDSWVVGEALPGVRDGYFLDLAATDGVSINNTLVLERDLGWRGLCIEPNAAYFAELKQNRSCSIANDCIDGKPGWVEFLANEELGGIVDLDTDNSPTIRSRLIDEWRAAGEMTRLQTRTLADVLAEYKAPEIIDYFSLDVEGAETRILRTFPFGRYKFLAATIERPTPEINALLFANGYLFVKNYGFDSFYIHETNPNALTLARQPFAQVPAKDW